jgi:YD repeat-containing protein
MYDANGNMITRVKGGQSYTLGYNAENQMTSVSGSAAASFLYDGDGRQVKATVGGTTTVYLGMYYEWTSSGNTKYYLANGVFPE